MFENQEKINLLLQEQSLLFTKLNNISQEISMLVNEVSGAEQLIKTNQAASKVRGYNPYSGQME